MQRADRLQANLCYSVAMVESRQAKHQPPRSPREERREELAATLRQAFPIEGAGSFAGLLHALEGSPR
jgi:hypothetical protein